jgi:hypothetical protein
MVTTIYTMNTKKSDSFAGKIPIAIIDDIHLTKASANTRFKQYLSLYTKFQYQQMPILFARF